ncbi:MAG TPA: putative quinol monooxygenase [Pyrinomonadaceae bacterium]|nr:putative quinol monooxygenase [Pyrinomonadaceae bacterium]
MYVVTVIFDIKLDHVGAFRAAILRNAAASLREEPGCHRFDVCFSEDEARCFLYELYDDRPAFDAHLKTVHFGEFDRTTTEMIIGKKLEIFLLAPNPVAEGV